MTVPGHRNVIALVVLLLSMTSAGAVESAQNDAAPGTELAPPIAVGVYSAPPYLMKNAEGKWEGISIDLWEKMAPLLKVSYDLHEYRDVKQALAAISAGKLDVTLVLPSEEEFAEILDFTVSYHQSGLAIAVPVPASGAGSSWLGYLEQVDVASFFAVVGTLVLLWLVAGASLWMFEKRSNKEMFGNGAVEGLGHATWWAAVTMTTVGYGDKAPRTLGGRFIAVIWMFVSIILISSFTASISASLTTKKLMGKVRGPQDLPHVRVGTRGGGEAVDWLTEQGIAAATFSSSHLGMQALIDDKIDAFVFDKAVLQHVASKEFPGRINVQHTPFKLYYVNMGVQRGSELRKPINRAMLKVLESPEWRRLLRKYIPSAQ